MDSQQAKQILELYRPGVDDDDPQFAEALAQARRDPELSRWLEQQIAFDATIRTKLRSVEAPFGLKTRILANAKADRPTNVWAWIAPAAAVIVAVVALLWLLPQRGTSFAAYRAEMVRFVSADYKLDLETGSFEQLRQSLVRNHFPAIVALPPALARVKLEGGCLRDWHGHKVTLVCMEVTEDHDVWLFLAERAAVPDASMQTEPTFAQVGKMMTASWSDDKLSYLLVAESDEATLRKYL